MNDSGLRPVDAATDAPLLLDQISAALTGRRRREIPLEGFLPAAVVVPLISTPEGLCVLFTVRTVSVEQHKGEISFPGGRVDPDDQDTLSAAFREAEEEVGLRRGDGICLGCLDDFVSVTGYRVTPHVIHVPESGYAFQAAPEEVAEILLVPLSHLLDQTHHRTSAQHDSPWLTHYFQWGPYVIWGLTAAILKRFLDLSFGYSSTTP